MNNGVSRDTSFAFEPGRILAGKYIVGEFLGGGWEGEVYHVTEAATGVERAAKFFFPPRNVKNRALTFYARKLDKLKDCSVVIPYHTQETIRYKGRPLTFLVSDYVEGELLTNFLKRQKGRRLTPFEALHLLHTLTVGVEQIHDHGEYHGDLHADNIIVKRVGLGFRVKLVDFYHWGRRTPAHVLDDICDLIRIFYNAVGGPKRYPAQPPEVKAICCGLKRSLIEKKFRNAARLRRFIETLEWS